MSYAAAAQRSDSGGSLELPQALGRDSNAEVLLRLAAIERRRLESYIAQCTTTHAQWPAHEDQVEFNSTFRDAERRRYHLRAIGFTRKLFQHPLIGILEGEWEFRPLGAQ